MLLDAILSIRVLFLFFYLGGMEECYWDCEFLFEQGNDGGEVVRFIKLKFLIAAKLTF